MKITPDKPISARGLAVFAAVAAAAIVAASLLDPLVYWAFRDCPLVREPDWHRMFRVMGYLPLWLAGAVAMLLVDSGKTRREPLTSAWRRAGLLATSTVLAGIAGEILKIVLRRERPITTGGLYVFRPWLDHPLKTVNLALPSGHAMVAFAAAWILSFLFPRAAVVWLLLAVGCAATRVIARAHFLSDVVVSALASYAVVRLIWQWHMARPKRKPTPAEPADGKNHA